MSDRSSTPSSCSEKSREEAKGAVRNNGGAAKPRTFRIPSHSENLLQSLNRQRANGEFCDITVLVEHQRFTAHKCVLSTSSAYFRSLLSNENDGVFLRHVTADSFAAILDFMYTSKLQIEPTAVHDILAAAKFLQVKGVISICCRYLESQIRTLARDLDEHTKDNPQMISVDGDFFKNQAPNQLQPQQVNYNPNQQQQTGQYLASPRIHDLYSSPNDRTVDSNNIQQRMSVAAAPMASYSGQATNLVPMNATKAPVQDLALSGYGNYPLTAPRNDGTVIQQPQQQQQVYLQPFQEATFRADQQRLPVNQQQQPQQQLWQGDFSNQQQQQQQPLYQYIGAPKPPSAFTNGHNPFSIAAPPPREHLPLPPIMSKRNPGLPTAQSTGGKGRRPHLQPRRKGDHQAVSESAAAKFRFTPNKPTGVNSLGREARQGDVLMLSSARPAGSERRRFGRGSPDTVFDVEAEDRYWDALSTAR